MLHHHVWLGGSVALGALLLTAGTPLQAWSSLTTSLGGPAGGDPFAPVIAVVALTAWLVVTYLGAVAAVLLLARLPGATGAVFRVLGRLLAPALLRRTLELALGLSVVAGGLGLSTATANATTEGPGTEVSQEAGLPDLDWPLTPDSTPSTPAPAPAPSPARPRPRRSPPPRSTSSFSPATRCGTWPPKAFAQRARPVPPQRASPRPGRSGGAPTVP